MPRRAHASRAIAKLRRHAHVDRDTIPFLEAQALEHVGKLLDLQVELAECKSANLSRLALPQDGDFVLFAAQGVAIDGVIAEIDFAAGEPFGVRRLPVQHLGPGREPVQFLR